MLFEDSFAIVWEATAKLTGVPRDVRIIVASKPGPTTGWRPAMLKEAIESTYLFFYARSLVLGICSV